MDRRPYYNERYYRLKYGKTKEEVQAEKKQARTRKHYQKYPYTVIRNQQLLRLYGITIDDYNRMLEEQGGVCAICQIKSGKTLHVDHKHVEGYSLMTPEEKRKYVRGLLCSRCNTTIFALEDFGFVDNARKYLKNYS